MPMARDSMPNGVGEENAAEDGSQAVDERRDGLHGELLAD